MTIAARTDAKWRSSVQVTRGAALDQAMKGAGRATAFDFAGTGSDKTWIGAVTNPPNHNTGPHTHGRHEAAIFIVRGRGQIRWGERLEFAADVGPGDFVYFAPFVPHQELNHSGSETFDFIVVRSDNERITVPLDIAPVDRPESIY